MIRWGPRQKVGKRQPLGTVLLALAFCAACGAQSPSTIRLTDVTGQTGIAFKHHDGSSGKYYIVETVCAGLALFDYDCDGDVDIYFLNGGTLKGANPKTQPRNALYRNDGNWKFTDVTKQSGLGDPGHALGTAVGDYDGDGDPDVYVTNFGPNVLFRNNGDGTFTDVTTAAGVADGHKVGAGANFLDMDNDGDTDIFVANDQMQNFLWQNDGTGRFEEIGLLAGVGYDMNGDAMGSMGVGCSDFNHDGLIDFYVTAYQQQFPSLYKNLGDGMFEDATFLTGAGAGTVHTVTWGNDFADLDNDGDRDMFIALGHLADNVEKWDQRSSYFATNLVFMNTGKEKFVNVSDSAGDGMKVKLSSRGVGLDDLDNDGDIDIVVQNSRREPTLLRNDSPKQGHWLQIRLKGVKANRNGVGARVTVVAGDLTAIDEVHSGRGYQSHYGARLYFGLGNHQRVDRLEVRWPAGGVDVFKNVAADQLVTLIEGQSQAALP